MAKEIKLAKPESDEMCPPGYHVVHGHERTCHSGTGTWVDTHIRSSASGLMQITNQTRRILSGRPNKDGRREIRSDYLEISKTDIHDPVVAIAAGTRWFAHKYDKVPKPAKKTLHNTIKNYHSWDDQGEAYAKTVESLYGKSKKSR